MLRHVFLVAYFLDSSGLRTSDVKETWVSLVVSRNVVFVEMNTLSVSLSRFIFWEWIIGSFVKVIYAQTRLWAHTLQKIVEQYANFVAAEYLNT